MAEEEGNPWWIWILILLAFVAFGAFVLWYWMRSGQEEEEAPKPAAEAGPPTPVSPVEAEPPKAEAPQPEKAAAPDDLKVVEGIGPKIASVLRTAGVETFAQLAAADVDRLKEILEAADPNLLRLADPTTWPEQARLAAGGEWEALEKLQDELKGGRRA
jgi:predicted flap endonuclease-1-like 5' DNA nuclease